jgi:uncharacterized protein YecE (DUF72 family)
MSKLVGTSGFDFVWWSQQGNHQTFFPPGCRNKLNYYASKFNLAEMNCTFFRLPTEKTVKNWYNQTPDDFKFILKFSRYITHLKRFKDFEQGWDKFMENTKYLKNKYYGVLFQFPPTFNYTEERAELFRQAEQYMKTERTNYKEYLNNLEDNVSDSEEFKLKSRRPLIYIEFRHNSWFDEEAIELIKELKWILVNAHHHDGNKPEHNIITRKNYIMLRMHGTASFAHGGYSDEQLAILASEIYDTKNIVVTFNNTDSLEGETIIENYRIIPVHLTVNPPHAVKDGLQMLKLLK